MAVCRGRLGGDFDFAAGRREFKVAELDRGLGRHVNRRFGREGAEIAVEVRAL